MTDGPVRETWVVQGVNGGIVTLLFNGEICMLHTSDDRIFHPDALFARIAEGRPIEMTRPQLRELAQLIIRVLGDE